MEASMNDREAVSARYSELARTAAVGAAPVDTSDGTEMTGCGPSAYTDIDGLPADALRASLGCGNPVAVADLKAGDTVLDLGCGGGLDVLLSARRVGPTGHVYGLDASPDMIALARRNASQAGVSNVEFLTGYLEDVPLPAASLDVIISNCVINLSTDKPRALAEAARVLRPGGRLGITDVIAADNLDPARRTAAEHAVGCATGTLTIGDYRQQLRTAGSPTSPSPQPTNSPTGSAPPSSRPTSPQTEPRDGPVRR
jgi:SAM-dependent methyltransferase